MITINQFRKNNYQTGQYIVGQVNRFLRKPVKWLKITLNGINSVRKRFICTFMEILERMKCKAFLHEKTPKKNKGLISKIYGELFRNCELFVSLNEKILNGEYRKSNTVIRYVKARRQYFNWFEIKDLLILDIDCFNLGLRKKFCTFDIFAWINGCNPCF